MKMGRPAALTIIELRELHALGLSAREAAERLGCTEQTVRNHARFNGIGFARDRRGRSRSALVPTERSTQMAALYSGGYTLEQIGRQFGITRERVRQIISRLHGMNGMSGGKHKSAQEKAALRNAAKNASCLKKWGCTWGQYVELRRMKKPTRAYCMQRRNAISRGIPWEFNLWQWWMVWQESGHWEHRGRGQGYMMCRKRDAGPYSVENVFIATGIENSSTGPHKKSGLPTGVSRKNGNSFCAHRLINGKRTYLGSFRTAELAHGAYLASFVPAHGAAA